MTLLAQRYPIPLNRAALMSQIQHMTGVGYTYWHAGSVHIDKAPGVLEKFASLYPILATPSQRSTNRRRGVANVELLWAVDEIRPDHVRWYLLATKGKGDGTKSPFTDLIHQREKMKDARLVPVLWGEHYMLHQRIMSDPNAPEDRQRKRGTRLRWTWSMTPGTYCGWKEQVVQAAQRGDREYQNVFSHLIPSPMFGGIRQDLKRLEAEGLAAWKKAHRNASYRAPLPHPLPTMPRIQVYGALTLWTLVERVRDELDTVRRQAEAEAQAALSQ